jgi:phage baseplate assembly protein V
MSYDITELDRRLANLIRLGRVEAVDYPNARLRVKVGGILTDWLPWLTGRAGGDRDWHAPEIGEQVLLLAPSGELNQAVVLAAVFQTAFPQPVNSPDKHHMAYSDGAVIEYDRAAHHLKAVLPAGGTLELTADGGITIAGDITLTGTLTASVDVVANGISLHDHVHGGVQAGAANTGVPA